MPRKRKEDKGKGPASSNTSPQTPKQILAQKAQTLAHSTTQKILKPSLAQPIKSWMDIV